MDKKLMDMLKPMDRIEYHIRKTQDRLNVNGAYTLGLFAWVGAAIIAKYNLAATFKLLMMGIVIPVIGTFFVLFINSYLEKKLDKEFTEKALDGNKNKN